jgi:hypothetical protein
MCEIENRLRLGAHTEVPYCFLLNGESREHSCKLNLVAKNGHTCWTWWRAMNIPAERSGEWRNYQLNLQLLTAIVFSWY